MICNAIVFYIKTDANQWYELITCDGINSIHLLESEPVLLNLNEIKDDFAYPIEVMQNKYINKKIIDIQEYVSLKANGEYGGFYIALEDNNGFSLFDNDVCFAFTDGMRTENDYELLSCQEQ